MPRRQRRPCNSHTTMPRRPYHRYSFIVSVYGSSRWLIYRAPSRSDKPLRLAYDSLRLASRLRRWRKLWRLTADWHIIYIITGNYSHMLATPPALLFVILSAWHFVVVYCSVHGIMCACLTHQFSQTSCLLARPVSDLPTIFSLARRQFSLAFLAEREKGLWLVLYIQGRPR